MSQELARFDRSLRRRKTSGIEGEAEVTDDLLKV
jgi:hypothetical protein